MERLTQKLKQQLPRKQTYQSDADVFLQRLGFVERRRFGRDRVVNNPDDPRFAKHVHQIFPPGLFVYGDVFEAITSVAPILTDALSGESSEKAKTLIIDFGVKVTPILEASSPLAMKKDPNEIAGRVGHSLARVHSAVRVTNNEPMSSRIQKDHIIFAYSDALMNPQK